MFDEISLHKMQEDEGFGLFLIETVGELLGGLTNIKEIEKKFKEIHGISVVFDAEGILIVSPMGNSERVSLKNIDYDDEGTAELKTRINKAVVDCKKMMGDLQDTDYCGDNLIAQFYKKPNDGIHS